MKKRILSILLTLCMAICLVPTSVFAEGETTKKVETEQELVDALADSSVSLIALKNDIAVRATLTVDRAVTLDLYGYMLEISGNGSVIRVADGGHLTLADSDRTSTYYFTPEDDGLWKWGTTGTKTVNGGVIYGGTGSSNRDIVSGGGVYVENGGQFTMTGGNIVGCIAMIERVQAKGGGVYVENGGQFTMTGGSIAGCTAIAAQLSASAKGGGICNEGTTTLSGTAEIRDCRITHAGNLLGGGVYDSGVLHISGSVKITGCRAEGFESDAMYVNSGSTIDGGFFDGSAINCGKITGGTLKKEVTNIGGMITGGIFYGGITNENGGNITGITVTYKDGNADYAKQVLQSGMTAQKPNDPAKNGYIFIGWYDGDTAYDFDSIVTGNITLTAKWVKIADKTADFTADDGGAEAIALLNSAKTGVADSIWDNGTKTLILKGIYFATTATTAVKLPDGATVILADGTENRIIGGGATVTQDRTYQNQIYIYGIYAAGKLTIQGETNGTGTLFVNSGEHINNGNAWTYSVGLYAEGDLTVNGGAVTAQGGKTSSADCAFSLGVQLSKGHSLSVDGGTLTVIGGESFDTEDPNDITESFSEGIGTDNGNVTVSGSGKLIAETVPSMADKFWSYGLNIVSGSLTVKDGASVSATACRAVKVYDGDIIFMGGKLSALATSYLDAVSVTGSSKSTAKRNIEISGGTFECVGSIEMSHSPRVEGTGVLSVAGGNLTAGRISGADTISVSGGSVTSGRIDVNTVELQSGSLTVREQVYKYEQINRFYASSVFYCKNLIVSGGTLDAAWDWGEYTPIVFSWNDPEPMIKMINGTASFGGGTVILDTGCSGNTAIKVENLNLSGGIVGSGYTNENGSDTYIQKDGDTPVKFVVYPANYTNVDEAIKKANALNKDDYKDFSAVEAAINAVVREKNIDEQAVVDAMAKAIEDAIAALKYKDADYSKVDEALAKANALNKDEYKDFTAVQAAIDAVARGKNITEQTDVDAMAKAIEDAIDALEYKDADYSKVDEALAKANALNKDEYKDFTAVETAVDAVVRGKNITDQAAVNAMAKAIEDAIAALEYKDADYSKVDEALAKANALNKDEYKDFTAVQAAIDAVARGKNITEQTDVDAMAKAIEDAIDALEYKDADYSKVDEALAKANALNKDEYKDFTAVETAVDAVVRGKNITEQADVDAMAKAIEDAINSLEKKPAKTKPESGDKSLQTGDNSNLMLWFALLFVSGGICTALTVKRKKSYRQGGNAK